MRNFALFTTMITTLPLVVSGKAKCRGVFGGQAATPNGNDNRWEEVVQAACNGNPSTFAHSLASGMKDNKGDFDEGGAIGAICAKEGFLTTKLPNGLDDKYLYFAMMVDGGTGVSLDCTYCYAGDGMGCSGGPCAWDGNPT